MENGKVTVEKLYRQLGKVIDAGYGDMPVMIRDDVLHDDEIVFNFSGNRCMRIDGMLYNNPQYAKISNFKKSVEKAWEEMITRD